MLYQLRIKIGAGELQDKEMYVGTGTVFVSQFITHIPMPVGTDTISPAIPDAQYKPGESS